MIAGRSNLQERNGTVPFCYGLRQEQIMSEDSVLQRGELALHELESPESVPAFARERDLQARTQEAISRNSSLQEGPVAKGPASPLEVEEGRPWPTKQPRNGFLHRRPVISAMGAVLLASILGGGYLYVDYARRFQSTDDAFIAARQSALAPKVSGYITAVPVTDNEHVAVGDVIARIDDRDYRIALNQAEAQVAAAQASIENVDAQLGVQEAQVSANQAQVDQAQAALVFAQQQAERYQHLKQTGYGTVQDAEQYTSQLHQQQAALQSAQATLNLAQRQLGS